MTNLERYATALVSAGASALDVIDRLKADHVPRREWRRIDKDMIPLLKLISQRPPDPRVTHRQKLSTLAAASECLPHNEDRLVLINGDWAWFVGTDERHSVWGLEWDAPGYEIKAGSPIPPESGAYSVLAVHFSAPHHVRPCELVVPCPWSVKQINEGAVAWLGPDPTSERHRGVRPIEPWDTFHRFRTVLHEGGGVVWQPLTPETLDIGGPTP